MLILMADIHSKADQPCSALPYALSAWLHATELGMDLKVLYLYIGHFALVLEQLDLAQALLC
jgi:hypothetical protein